MNLGKSERRRLLRRSFDYGEYACAQDAPCWRLGIEAFSVGIAVPAAAGKSWRENKMSRDILEELDSLRDRSGSSEYLRVRRLTEFSMRYPPDGRVVAS